MGGYRGLMRKLVLLVVALAGIALVATVPAGAATSVRTVRTPSKSAKMICQREAQDDITRNLGNVRPTTVTAPTWNNAVYSCQYVYPSGVVTLSVKELPATASSTKAYFQGLEKTLGRRGPKLGLAGGAFRALDGSVVVRKDTKVLDVDVSKLSAPLGVPPQDAPTVAISLAVTVLGCWTGA